VRDSVCVCVCVREREREKERERERRCNKNAAFEMIFYDGGVENVFK
jgi:hypothetical protein